LQIFSEIPFDVQEDNGIGRYVVLVTLWKESDVSKLYTVVISYLKK